MFYIALGSFVDGVDRTPVVGYDCTSEKGPSLPAETLFPLTIPPRPPLLPLIRLLSN